MSQAGQPDDGGAEPDPEARSVDPDPDDGDAQSRESDLEPDQVTPVRWGLAGHVKALTAVTDQGVSSVTNLALSLLVARISSPDVFGALGIVTAVYLLEVGLSRGAISDPYTVLSAGHEDDRRRDAISAAFRTGLALSAVHASVGLLFDGSLRTFLLTYAALTLGLVVQDAARMMLIANGLVAQALVSNLLWAVIQAALSGFAIAADSGQLILVAWAVGGWASGAYCLFRLGCWPLAQGDWRRWFRDHRRLALSWSAEQISQNGLFQMLMWTVGIVAGLEAVGSYRGALVLVGPATIVIGGLVQFLLRVSVQHARAGGGVLAPFITKTTLGLGALSSLVLLPLLLLPDSAGEWFLGESWDGARTVLPYAIAARILAAMVAGLVLGLRATAEYRTMLQLRLATGFVMLTTATAAAAVWDVVAAAATVVVVNLISLPLWAWASHRRMQGSAAGHAHSEHSAT